MREKSDTFLGGKAQYKDSPNARQSLLIKIDKTNQRGRACPSRHKRTTLIELNHYTNWSQEIVKTPYINQANKNKKIHNN